MFKHSKITLSIAALACAAFTGCGIPGASTPSKFFVLSAKVSKNETIVSKGEKVPSVGVSRVTIPSFLERPQFVTKVADNQVTLSEFNRWGEPLESGFTRVLREDLALLLGPGEVSAFPWLQSFPQDFTLSVVILAFEPDVMNNQVILQAFYRISSKAHPNLMVRESEFNVPIASGEEDYEAIVEAMSEAIAMLARQVAKEVVALPLQKK